MEQLKQKKQIGEFEWRIFVWDLVPLEGPGRGGKGRRVLQVHFQLVVVAFFGRFYIVKDAPFG